MNIKNCQQISKFSTLNFLLQHKNLKICMKGSQNEQFYELRQETKIFMSENKLINEIIKPRLEKGKVTIWTHGYPCEVSEKQTRIVKKILRENKIDF